MTRSRPLILVLVGTKAQFIKLAPILREMDQRGVDYTLVYTGQHHETFDLLESTFQTRAPDDVLGGQQEASTHLRFLRWTLTFWCAALRRVLSGQWANHRVAVVHGDTASTLFGAIAARLAGITVAHVEAGLRSPRLFDPFPEELVRRLVRRLSRLHLAPDTTAASNLREAHGKVLTTTGNSLQDSLRLALTKFGALPEHGGSGGYGVVSIHRNENLQNRRVFDFLMNEILQASTIAPLRFVLHPATRERLKRTGWVARLEQAPGLELVERMDYPDFVRLLISSNFLMTDGGSNQEEASILGLPTLLLRRVTERNDGLGDVVEISRLEQGAVSRFVSRFAGKTWSLRLPPVASPSRVIVDALIEAAARKLGHCDAKPRLQ